MRTLVDVHVKTLSVYAENARLKKRVRELRRLLEECRVRASCRIKKKLNL